jgi:hypothetical protein
MYPMVCVFLGAAMNITCTHGYHVTTFFFILAFLGDIWL